MSLRHRRTAEPSAHPDWLSDDERTLKRNQRHLRRESVRTLAELTKGTRFFGFGPPGPSAGVVWLKEKRPPLDETTDQLAGTYPFVAGSGLPYFGQYHGVNRLSGSAWGWDGQVAYAHGIVSNPAMD